MGVGVCAGSVIRGERGGLGLGALPAARTGGFASWAAESAAESGADSQTRDPLRSPRHSGGRGWRDTSSWPGAWETPKPLQAALVAGLDRAEADSCLPSCARASCAPCIPEGPRVARILAPPIGEQTGRWRGGSGGARVIIMQGARSWGLQLFSLANPWELSGDRLLQPFLR